MTRARSNVLVEDSEHSTPLADHREVSASFVLIPKVHKPMHNPKEQTDEVGIRETPPVAPIQKQLVTLLQCLVIH